jgi:cobalt-zinc-cadmium efflux system protein
MHLHRNQEIRSLRVGLAVILAFMVVEVVVAVLAHSLALLSDAAHMLTDSAALAMALLAAHLAERPAKGPMTFGLGRVEIVSAGANGMTLLVLALVVVYGAVARLLQPHAADATAMLAVALVGVVVNFALTRVLGHPNARAHAGLAPQTYAGEQAVPAPVRSLNVEGSYQHIVTDLAGFAATAVAAIVILMTGFQRADAIASLVIAAVMLHSGYKLGRQSLRVLMEGAPAGLDPLVIGRTLAAWPDVVEVHDLHIWEVTSGFNAVAAHVLVTPGCDCHAIRRDLAKLLQERFGLAHSTLQVEHARSAEQQPLQIETTFHRAP